MAWEIPFSIRYRFAFIPDGCSRPAVLYDNHHPKGHHKHLDGMEKRSSFVDIGRLIEDFEADIESWKRKMR